MVLQHKLTLGKPREPNDAFAAFSPQASIFNAIKQCHAWGGRPITLDEVVERRLAVLTTEDERVKDNWLGNYIVTGSGVLYFRGMVYLLPSATVSKLDEYTQKYDGFVLTEEQAREITRQVPPSHIFEPRPLRLDASHDETQDNVRANYVWSRLVRGPILHRYAGVVSELSDSEKVMGITLRGVGVGDFPQEPTLRLLAVGPTYSFSRLSDGKSKGPVSNILIGKMQKHGRPHR